MQIAVPNFFFHATMACSILRHNGVDLGKMDYIGSIPTQAEAACRSRVSWFDVWVSD
jgi:hypothetical protein